MTIKGGTTGLMSDASNMSWEKRKQALYDSTGDQWFDYQMKGDSKQLLELIETLSQLLAANRALLKGARLLLKANKVFLLATINPLLAVVLVVLEEFDKLVADFMNTGIYFMVCNGVYDSGLAIKTPDGKGYLTKRLAEFKFKRWAANGIYTNPVTGQMGITPGTQINIDLLRASPAWAYYEEGGDLQDNKDKETVARIIKYESGPYIESGGFVYYAKTKGNPEDGTDENHEAGDPVVEEGEGEGGTGDNITYKFSAADAWNMLPIISSKGDYLNSMLGEKERFYCKPSDHIRAVVDSFSDNLDPNKPVFTEGASVGAVVLMGVTSDPAKLLEFLTRLYNFFLDLPFLKDAIEAAEELKLWAEEQARSDIEVKNIVAKGAHNDTKKLEGADFRFVTPSKPRGSLPDGDGLGNYKWQTGLNSDNKDYDFVDNKRPAKFLADQMPQTEGTGPEKVFLKNLRTGGIYELIKANKNGNVEDISLKVGNNPKEYEPTKGYNQRLQICRLDPTDTPEVGDFLLEMELHKIVDTDTPDQKSINSPVLKKDNHVFSWRMKNGIPLDLSEEEIDVLKNSIKAARAAKKDQKYGKLLYDMYRKYNELLRQSLVTGTTTYHDRMKYMRSAWGYTDTREKMLGREAWASVGTVELKNNSGNLTDFSKVADESFWSFDGATGLKFTHENPGSDGEKHWRKTLDDLVDEDPRGFGSDEEKEKRGIDLAINEYSILKFTKAEQGVILKKINDHTNTRNNQNAGETGSEIFLDTTEKSVSGSIFSNPLNSALYVSDLFHAKDMDTGNMTGGVYWDADLGMQPPRLCQIRTVGNPGESEYWKRLEKARSDDEINMYNDPLNYYSKGETYIQFAGTQGTLPTWNSALKIGTLFPFMGTFFLIVRGLIESVGEGLETILKKIDKLEKYIKEQLDRFEKYLGYLEDFINILKLGIAGAGIFALNIPVSTGGTKRITSAIANATNAPSDSDYDYSFSISLLVGGANATRSMAVLGPVLGQADAAVKNAKKVVKEQLIRSGLEAPSDILENTITYAVSTGNSSISFATTVDDTIGLSEYIDTSLTTLQVADRTHFWIAFGTLNEVETAMNTAKSDAEIYNPWFRAPNLDLAFKKLDTTTSKYDYQFDTSHSSNLGTIFRIATTPDKVDGIDLPLLDNVAAYDDDNNRYKGEVLVLGIPGDAATDPYVQFSVPADVPSLIDLEEASIKYSTLYYYNVSNTGFGEALNITLNSKVGNTLETNNTITYS